MSKGNCGDQQVVRPDDLTARLQVITNFRVVTGGSVVERKRRVRTESFFDSLNSLFALPILSCSMKQFGPDDRANGNVRNVCLAQTMLHGRITILQVMDPSVGIQKIAHYHCSRTVSGSSGGASSGSSAKLPAVASKYPAGYPRASATAALVWARCSASASASRTACSNFAPVSGSTHPSTRSRSRARELMVGN